MPRKSTSSSITPGDAPTEEMTTTTTTATATGPSQSHTTTSGAVAHNSNIQATEQQLKARAEGGVSIEDYLLPRSLTLRLAKSVLPPNTSIQKDAVLALQKAATVFVSYLSSHANEATLKRTVAPSDVLSAISELEFDSFRPRLEKELDMFTELKAGKRKGNKKDTTTNTNTNTDTDTTAAKNGNTNLNQAQEAGNHSNGTPMVAVSEAVVIRGAKRVKRGVVSGGESDLDKDRDQKSGKKGRDTVGEGEEDEEDGDDDGDDDDDDNEEDDDDDDETQVQVDENETEEEEEDEDEEEDDEEDRRGEDDDIDRVEDLDRARRPMDPDAGGDTESDDEVAG